MEPRGKERGLPVCSVEGDGVISTSHEMRLLSLPSHFLTIFWSNEPSRIGDSRRVRIVLFGRRQELNYKLAPIGRLQAVK